MWIKSFKLETEKPRKEKEERRKKGTNQRRRYPYFSFLFSCFLTISQMKKISILKLNAGISLIEIIIYIAVFSIVAMLTARFVAQGYKVYYFGQEQSDAIRSAQKGVEIMVKEIREARHADNGAYPLGLSNDQEFIFYSDIDQDNYTEKVRYFLDGENFKKGIINPSETEPINYDGEEMVTILSEYVRNGAEPIF